MLAWLTDKWTSIDANIRKLSPEERANISFVLDITKTIFGALTLLSLAAAFFGVFLTIQNTKDEYAWRRKQFAEAQLQGWDGSISRTKNRVDAVLTRWGYKENEHRLRPEHAEHIWHALESDEECWKLERDITSMLNYFESVSSGVIEQTSNRSTIERSMRGTMTDWRLNLAEYTAHADLIRKRPTWEPFYTLTREWSTDPKAMIKKCTFPQVTCPPGEVPAVPGYGLAGDCAKLERVHAALKIPPETGNAGISEE